MSKLIGNNPNQVPTNADLGALAYVDKVFEEVNVITGNTTATSGNLYVINGSAVTLTLPASPSNGDYVVISDVSGNTNNIIARNGSNIMSLAEDLNLDQTYFNEKMVYTGATVGWAFA